MKQSRPSVSPMSNEARNTYVIEHITDALLELLRTKPIGEVSVSELCGRAGVGRASFYRNFASKEAVLQRRDEALLRQWQQSFEHSGQDGSRLMLSLMLHYQAHRDFYTLVYRNDSSILLSTILRICGPAEADGNAAAYSKAFLAYAIYGIVSEWIARGMTESAEELAALLLRTQKQ